jgi:hypothetical protein
MSNAFDYQSFFDPTPPQTFLSYAEIRIRDERDDEYIIQQFSVDESELPGLYFDEVAREETHIREPIDREAVNAFLTRVCAMIDVDPSEAIAQNFEFYLSMIEWLRSRYHTRVIELYEVKLERYYQAICEALYARCTDNGNPIDSNRFQMVIANNLQHLFWDIINITVWWDSTVHWILDLSDETNIATTIANMLVLEDIEDELNRILVDEAIEPETQEFESEVQA